MCSIFFYVSSCIYSVVVAVLWISILYGWYRIVFKNDTKEKLTKFAKTLRGIFLISCVICVGYFPIFRWRTCKNIIPWDDRLLDPVLDIFIGTEFLILSILYFMKIVDVFQGTSYQITNLTKIVYYTLYILGGIFIILLSFVSILQNSTTNITYIGPFKTDSLHFIILTFLEIVYIVGISSMTGLFIHKLVIVYKIDHRNNDNSDNALMTPITKLTILISLSLIISLFHIGGATLSILYPNEVTVFIKQIFAVLDHYTNFVNVMLTYKMFDGYYGKICGPLHNLCTKCWMKLIDGGKGDVKIMNEIMRKRKITVTDETRDTHCIESIVEV